MNLLEHQAKQLLRDRAVPVPHGILIREADQALASVNAIDAPFWMVKAQIHAGERAGHGAVVRVDNAAAAVAVADSMLGQRIRTPQTPARGDLVREVLVEAGCPPVRELYLAALIDPARAERVLLGSRVGGSVLRELDLAARLASSDTEVTHVAVPGPGPVPPDALGHLATELAIDARARSTFDTIVTAMHDILIRCDATLVEVNPLAVLADESLMCLDCKISVDPNALYRQPSLGTDTAGADTGDELQRSNAGFNFTRLDGDVGCLVTGAGLALATMDMLVDEGFAPANFLDLPPGASVETVTAAVTHIMDSADPAALFVNAIEGGFTVLDTVAQGLINAANRIGDRRVVIRFAGAGQDRAILRLVNSPLNFVTATGLDDAIQLLREARP